MRIKKTKTNKKRGGTNVTLLFRVLVFLALFILTLCIVFAVIFVSAYYDNILRRYKGTTALYQIGIDNLSDTTTKYVTLENMYRYGYLYICMDDVARMCDMTCVGDYDSRTYYPVDDPGQSVTFRFGSDNAVIKGEGYAMNGSMYEENGKVYVPASFFNHFCSGVDVLVGETKSGMTKITLCRVSLGAESDLLGNTVQIYAPIQYNATHGEELKPIKQGKVFSSALPPVAATQDQQPGTITNGQGTPDAQQSSAQQSSIQMPQSSGSGTVQQQNNTGTVQSGSGQGGTTPSATVPTEPAAPPLSNLMGD